MSIGNPTQECLDEMLREFGSSAERVKCDVRVIQGWLQQQPHMPNILDEASIENMLVRCKCSVERAKQTLDMHLTLKTALPEFFAQRDPMCRELQDTMDTILLASLPRVTDSGCRVGVFKILTKSLQHVNAELWFKYMFMVADIRSLQDKCFGDVYIFDGSNLVLGHVTKFTLPMFKKIETVCRQAYQTRVKGIHFVNCPPAADLILKMVKSVLNAKVSARLHVHDNMASLHRHVDKKLLPVDYGGEEKSLRELGVEWRRKTESFRNWFLDQELNGKVDESKRPGRCITSSELFGFEGTFKKLTVD